ncbi:MAG TPA: alpha/beta fold hydrolase [Polyangiaceae bacterium]|nr:alpha/beta fold hydrolase [Polyangiaceae bacterium]
MNQCISRDGTPIAFDQQGQGPALILVLGAFNDRRAGAALAQRLSSRFQVFNYDRRGRGQSGDAAQRTADRHDSERELDDLEALIGAAGGSAAVCGYSSGASLALLAAARGARISRLVLYELPPGQSPAHAAELASLIAEDRRGDAVEYFQRRLVGIPEPVVARLRHAPFRPELEAMAHTLVYDASLVASDRITPALLSTIQTPSLALAGSESPPGMREAAEAAASALPNGRALILPGATHDLDPELLAPALESFL